MNTFFRVQRVYLENTEPGHDKFYQLFLIQERESGQDGRSVQQHVVAHYGRRKQSEGTFSRPVKGGQIKHYAIARGAAGGGIKYHDLKAEKRKKGYDELKTTESESTKEGFLAWVLKEFGAAEGHRLLQNFGLTLDGDDVAVPEPSDEPDNEISAEPERPDHLGRGSW